MSSYATPFEPLVETREWYHRTLAGMRPVPLFRAAALRPLLDYVAHLDSSATRIFGTRVAALRDASSVLPLTVGGVAYEVAARELGQPELGLRVGESTRIERIGELGTMLRSSLTVGGALATATRYGSRFNTGQRFWLVERGEHVWLHRSFASSLSRGRQEISDLVLALALQVVRLGAGPGWRPAEIHFEGAAPTHAERLAALATHSVRFGGATTAIAIPRRVLALRLPERRIPSGPESGGALPSIELRTSLLQTVEALLRLGEPEVAAAAEAAGTSVRSLQRHLSRQGVSFADLVQQVRCRAAVRLLADGGLKIVEVSAALGYTDSANFTRAFRRWTGLSPQAFRRAAAELPDLVTGVTPAEASPASLPIG